MGLIILFGVKADEICMIGQIIKREDGLNECLDNMGLDVKVR